MIRMAKQTREELEAAYVESGGVLATRNPLELLAEQFGTLTEEAQDFEDIGFGEIEAVALPGEWELVKASELVGVPFKVVGVHLNFTDLSSEGTYANIRCITLDSRKVSFNDGSTGVYKQLKDIAAKWQKDNMPARPILVKGGLRASVYHWDEQSQAITPGNPNAATFYLTSSIAGAEKTRALLSAIGK
jgi:hypothetical protein